MLHWTAISLRSIAANEFFVRHQGKIAPSRVIDGNRGQTTFSVMSVNVKLDDLLTAFEWVSVSGPLESSAFISKETGSMYLRSNDYELEDELLDDLDDPSRYISVSHKNDLDLGK